MLRRLTRRVFEATVKQAEVILIISATAKITYKYLVHASFISLLVSSYTICIIYFFGFSGKKRSRTCFPRFRNPLRIRFRRGECRRNAEFTVRLHCRLSVLDCLLSGRGLFLNPNSGLQYSLLSSVRRLFKRPGVMFSPILQIKRANRAPRVSTGCGILQLSAWLFSNRALAACRRFRRHSMALIRRLTGSF